MHNFESLCLRIQEHTMSCTINLSFIPFHAATLTLGEKLVMREPRIHNDLMIFKYPTKKYKVVHHQCFQVHVKSKQNPSLKNFISNH